MRKLSLANLPTKIEKLTRWSAEKGVNIYIKRDDQTGSEWNGNKIRKLEFALHEARDRVVTFLLHAEAFRATTAGLPLLLLQGSA